MYTYFDDLHAALGRAARWVAGRRARPAAAAARPAAAPGEPLGAPRAALRPHRPPPSEAPADSAG
jgi:hypothetical protein